MQFDEKWDFAAKKEKNREPDEATAGDCWGHVALDPASRLVVSLVVGKRTAEATHELVADFWRRTGGWLPWLMTSDEYPVYANPADLKHGKEDDFFVQFHALNTAGKVSALLSRKPLAPLEEVYPQVWDEGAAASPQRVAGGGEVEHNVYQE